MEKKLLLPIVRPVSNKDKVVIRIDTTRKVLDKIHELTDETGLSQQYITGKMLEFMIDNVETVEEINMKGE